MIPNVLMRWCPKEAKCEWCEQPILCAEPEVVVFFWNKGSDNRRFNVKQYYHPQCWVAQGLDYLNRNPYVASTNGSRGRKPLSLTPEESRQRFLLVRRFHALEQRKQKLKTPYPDRLLLESRINKQMVDIMVELIPIGGIPTNWVEKVL